MDLHTSISEFGEVVAVSSERTTVSQQPSEPPSSYQPSEEQASLLTSVQVAPPTASEQASHRPRGPATRHSLPAEVFYQPSLDYGSAQQSIASQREQNRRRGRRNDLSAGFMEAMSLTPSTHAPSTRPEHNQSLSSDELRSNIHQLREHVDDYALQLMLGSQERSASFGPYDRRLLNTTPREEETEYRGNRSIVSGEDNAGSRAPTFVAVGYDPNIRPHLNTNHRERRVERENRPIIRGVMTEAENVRGHNVRASVSPDESHNRRRSQPPVVTEENASIETRQDDTSTERAVAGVDATVHEATHTSATSESVLLEESTPSAPSTDQNHNTSDEAANNDNQEDGSQQAATRLVRSGTFDMKSDESAQSQAAESQADCGFSDRDEAGDEDARQCAELGDASTDNENNEASHDDTTQQ